MKHSKNSKNSGFTLIELLAVMVILGILAASALPQFVDLTEEASIASVKAMAGSVESASNLNHAVNMAVTAGLSGDKVYGTYETCEDAAQALTITAIDMGVFTFTGTLVGTAEDGIPVECTVTRSGVDAADAQPFTIIAATAVAAVP